MNKNEFRGPLMQSAAVLGGVLILFAIIASSGANSSEGGILAIIFGVGNLILFFIGMGIALPLSIGILIAIFLAAVAMVDSKQASQIYSDLKKNFTLNAISLSKQCCGNNTTEICVTKEEYNLMKQEISQLQENNSMLQQNIKELSGDNALLQGSVTNLDDANSALKEKIEELSIAVEKLQMSENEIKDIVEKLSKNDQEGVGQEFRIQINKLEQLHADTHIEIENIVGRLKTLESGFKQSPTSGIFTYIEEEEDQFLFIQKVEEALAQDMTYAQIDEYLTSNLPPELDQKIKDHPSLTKNYIRNLRRD